MLENEPSVPDSTTHDSDPPQVSARRRRPAAKKTAAPPPAEATSAGPATDFAAAPAPRKRAAKKTTTAPVAEPASATTDAAPQAGAAAPTPAKRSARGRGAAKAAAAAAAAAAGEISDASGAVAAAATVGAAGANEPAHTVAAPVIPTVLFQAPQADAAPARRRRERVAGAPADPSSPEPVQAAGSDVGEPAAGAGSASTAELAEREGGRRRRRGGRGRRGHAEGRETGHDEHGGRDEHNETASDDDSAVAGVASEGAGNARRRTRARGASVDGDAQLAAPSEAAGAASEEDRHDGDHEHDGDHDGDGTASSRRRRRRRRRGAGGDGDEHASDDPPNTVVRVREPREHDDRGGVQGVKGSTRLEAKKQRRREGREQIRRGRRGLVITEAEFLARRESVDRIMVVRQRGDRTQIGVLEDGILVEHFVSTASTSRLVGNVYLGRVQNVLPGMEAAFVDIGKGRNAVLYAGEVNFDMSGMEGQARRIESALKSGQTVLVQVTKDPIGHKGARLTSQVSLPGRYLVYVPEGSMMGISRKLPDVERSRLKSILREVMPEGAGVIVRTAAEGASEEELARDVARLSAQWEDIKKKAETSNAPALLYGEPDLTIRVIRDVFNEDFNSLVVQAESEWDTVEAYVSHVAPDLVPRLSRWTSEEDIFTQYRIDEQIVKALDRKVWLPSGGYLVIDRTEAMIVIDVNTGRFIGKGGNLEETVTKNNLEAAEEIVRQLRLRDIGGIIVIDFIDMVLESNRELVLRRLVECLGRDRTKHQVAEVTSLGLVQMTRKRVGNGLLEAFSEVCEHCNGRGVIVHTDPVEQRPARLSPAKPAPPRGARGKRAVAAATELGSPDGAQAPSPEVAQAPSPDGAQTPSPDGAQTPSPEVAQPASSGGAGSETAASTGPRTRRGGRRRGGAKQPTADAVPEPA